VRGLDNYSNGRPANLAGCRDRIEMIEGDIRDLPTCRRACAEVDLIFHEAAVGSVPRSIEDPATTLAANVGGTANLFAAARDAIRLFRSSTGAPATSAASPARTTERASSPFFAPTSMYRSSNEELASFRPLLRDGADRPAILQRLRPRQDRWTSTPRSSRFFKAYAAGVGSVIYGDGDRAAISRSWPTPSRPISGRPSRRNPHSAGPTTSRAATATVNQLARAIREALGGGPPVRYEAARRAKSNTRSPTSRCRATSSLRSDRQADRGHYRNAAIITWDGTKKHPGGEV
jgi:hypothetical protein